MWENPMTYVGIGMLALWVIAYGIRFCRNWFAPVRTVDAKVVNKQPVDHFSKYSRTGKAVRKYAVTFSSGHKRLSFYVSEFSYGGYRIGESGKLTYKGERLIDFH